MLPIYEKIASLGLITVFHAAWILLPGSGALHAGTPCLYPSCLWECAGRGRHMADICAGRMCSVFFAGKALYFDTAFSFSRMPPDWAREIIRTHGTEKILLGSDMPGALPAMKSVL